jgi:superfamily I DNA and/or RNA helicase
LRAQWLAALERDHLLELTERVRAGASVVLATCSIAAAVLDRSRQRGDAFDWVIVEEAAKAWPTELIVPLVLGTRWTLIGDHRQLGAHRADMLARFLDSLDGYPDETVSQHFENKAQHLRVLALFASFFTPISEPTAADGPEAVEQHGSSAAGRTYLEQVRQQARGRLNRQFRMHPDIAQPVSRTFYRDEAKNRDADGLAESFLTSDESARKPHGLRRPKIFDGHSLVWLNTKGVANCLEVPRWHNPGEVEIIDRLVRAMLPTSADAGAEGERSLVVLTPYRAQLTELSRQPSLNGRVHTVHSFQGREADRVVVSLVRARRVSDDAIRNVGHVGQDEVANVLLSRAQRLMVLVGNIEHFGQYGGESWAEVVRVVRRFGLVVPASDWEYD